MSYPIRTGTARRLGLNPPPVPFGRAFSKRLTPEKRTEIERAWLLHPGPLPAIDDYRARLELRSNVAEEVHAVRPLVNEREAAILRAAGAPEGSFDVSPGVVKLSAYAVVPNELLNPAQPSAEDIARHRLEKQQLHAREDARHAELLAAGGVVTAVAELHSPEGDRECAGCDGATERPPDWPCRTWELLDETVPRSDGA